MRLFIAIDVPKKISGILSDFGQDMQNCLEANFTTHFHCTLRFIGDVDKQDAERIDAALASIDYPFFEVSLTKLDTFGDSIVFAGLQSPELMELQSHLESTLALPRADHDFHPHITIARIKNISNQEEFSRQLTLDLPKFTFDVVDFVLYESELSDQGPVYKEVRRYTLSQPRKTLQKNYTLPSLD